MIELEMERFCYEFCKPVRDNPILDLTKMNPNETDVFQYMKDIFQNLFSFIGDKASEINADYFTHYRAYGIMVIGVD
ncbi:hypothetical protein [Terribacillus saccharophilus]|uniref:hypothetical protein n=1 Tax=Terribacillus saccharophilus TaxID=361277 RepID=UPI002DC0DF4B|nr:hypothetical protein [Terribacillus saccharophilus]